MSDNRAARSLRLPREMTKEAEFVARVDGMSVNQLITYAVEDYLTVRSSSKEFRQKLAQCSKAERDMYERLASGNTTTTKGA